MAADPQEGCHLLRIPTETLEGIMFYLPATSLARLASCARSFRRLPDRVARDRVEQACGAEDAARYRRVPWLERLYLEEECAVGFDLPRCEAHGFRFSGAPVPGAPALDAAGAAAAGTPAGLSVIGGGALPPVHHPTAASLAQAQQPPPPLPTANADDGVLTSNPPPAQHTPHPRRTPGPPHARATGHVRLDGMGPKLLVSDRSTADQPVLRWRLAVRGNTAVEVGVVPVVMQSMPKALHKCWQSADMRALQVQQAQQQLQAQQQQAAAAGGGNGAAAVPPPGNNADPSSNQPANTAATATAAAPTSSDGGGVAGHGNGPNGADTNDAAAAAPALPPRAEAVGFSSGITVGSQLPVRVPIMKGSVVEVLAWRDARRVEFSVQNPPDGHELAWQGGRTVTRPYRGPRDLRLSMDFPDGSGDVKLALTCWAYGAFDVVHRPAKEAPLSMRRIEQQRRQAEAKREAQARRDAALARGEEPPPEDEDEARAARRERRREARRRPLYGVGEGGVPVDEDGAPLIARASKSRRLAYAAGAGGAGGGGGNGGEEAAALAAAAAAEAAAAANENAAALA